MERAFDDDRWPDHEGKACCFMCGHPVEPTDDRRGTYTGNAKVGGELPCHLACLEGQDPERIFVAWSQALMDMGMANVERARRNAAVAGAPVH